MNSVKLKEFLKDKRESLSASSVNTYTSVLRGMHKEIFGTSDVDKDNLDRSKYILDEMKDWPIPRKKTVLSALVVATNGLPQEAYRKVMMESLEQYRKEISGNEMTDKQRENWVTKEEIEKTLKHKEKEAKAIIKKGSPSTKEIQAVQDYLLLVLTSGVYFPPRRSLDWLAFKIRNIKESDNYLDKDKLVFNKYKTAKSYGQQVVKVPRKVVNAIKSYVSILPSDREYLLSDTSGRPLYRENEASGSVKVNQRISRMFPGKKVGVNTMRHTNLTEKFGDLVEERKMVDRKIAKELEKMGTSPAMLDTYVKIK